MRTVLLCLSEARPIVQVVVWLRFLTVATLSAGGVDSLRPVPTALGGTAVSAVSVSVYVLNGLSDLTADVANGSSRPLASGRLPVRSARIVCVLAAVLGLGCAGMVNLAVLGCALLMLAAGVRYSAGAHAWKNTSGRASLCVVALGACTYLAAMAASGHTTLIGGAVAVTMAAWMGLVGARAKDFADVAGDALAGRRTDAGRHSERATRGVVAVAAVGIAAGYLVFTMFHTTLLLSGSSLAVAAGLVAARCRLSRSTGDRARARRPYRAFMLGQYGFHAVLLLWPLT